MSPASIVALETALVTCAALRRTMLTPEIRSTVTAEPKKDLKAQL